MPGSVPPDPGTFQDPYTYPGTSVLKNLLRIQDQATLDVAERQLTWVRRQQIHASPINGAYDLDHLCAVHHWLFQDLFAWAGQIRTVEISKGNSDFQPTPTIHTGAAFTFGELNRSPLLGDDAVDEPAFLDHCADLLERLNYLHPFREGNGRTQRTFLDLIAARHDRTFSWRNVTAEENATASAEAVASASRAPLRTLLAKALAPPADGKTLLDEDLYAVAGPLTVYAPTDSDTATTCLRCGRPLSSTDLERGYDSRCWDSTNTGGSGQPSR